MRGVFSLFRVGRLHCCVIVAVFSLFVKDYTARVGGKRFYSEEAESDIEKTSRRCCRRLGSLWANELYNFFCTVVEL